MTRLRVAELAVETFEIEDSALNSIDPFRPPPWGSSDTQCAISACNSMQADACSSTAYGSRSSYWPNCNPSLGYP